MSTVLGREFSAAGYSRSSGRLRIETGELGVAPGQEAQLQPLFGAAED